ncbi:MAG: TetR/AcrR family transcriptional regulator [Actinobacteria bacterium]|nr:TetR/AcrR family transcriptional regulator [Actinomycetota bacterium]
MRTDDDLDPRVRRTQRDVVQAASELLLEEGWFALTHAAVASRAGYSKATLYNHWPDPADLGRAAFLHACATPHHEPTGDLRTDLIGELTAFSDALVNHHLARVIAALVEMSASDPASAEVLATFQAEGSAPMRQILVDNGYTGETGDVMLEILSGAVLYRSMLLQQAPTADHIELLVDTALANSER